MSREHDDFPEDPCDLMNKGLKKFNAGKVSSAYQYWYEASLENPSMIIRLLNVDVAEAKRLDEVDLGESWVYLNETWFRSWSLNYHAVLALSLMWYEPDFRWSIGIKVSGRKSRGRKERIPALDFEKIARSYNEVMSNESKRAKLWNAIIIKRIAYINAMRSADKTDSKQVTKKFIKLSRPFVELDMHMQDILERITEKDLSDEEIEKEQHFLRSIEIGFQFFMNYLNGVVQQGNSKTDKIHN